LRLLENGAPAGGGQFPDDQYDDALEEGQSWCDAYGAEVAEPDNIDHLSTETADPAAVRPKRQWEQAEQFRAEAAFEAAAPFRSRRVFLKTPAHTCCVGVDLPGVGHTHAPDCPAMARRAQMPETLADFVSEPACRRMPDQIAVEVRELIAEIDGAIAASDARRAHREGLLAQLLFAARDQAEQNILGGGWPAVADEPAPARWCRECQMTEHLGRLSHTDTCRTGRVLRIVADLILTLDPKGKEATPDLERGCAGDGIRPRGLTERVCLKCGVRGGVWHVSEVPAATFDLSLLGLNQVAGTAWRNDEVAIFTHECASLLRNGAEQKKALTGVDIAVRTALVAAENFIELELENRKHSFKPGDLYFDEAAHPLELISKALTAVSKGGAQ
jgi:hypothetical protein